LVCLFIAEEDSEAFKLKKARQNFLGGEYQVSVRSLSADETRNFYCLDYFFLNVTLLSESVSLLKFCLKNVSDQAED